MGFWKVAGVIVGGAVSVIAAPVVLPIAAVAGTTVLSVGTAVAGTAAAVGSTVAGTVGASALAGSTVASAAVGAVGSVAATATVVGSTVATVGSTVAGSAVGTAAIGAVSSAGATVVGAATAAASTTVGTAVAGIGMSSVLEGTTAAVIGSGLTYTGITSADGFLNMSDANEKISKANSIYSDKTTELEIEKKRTSKKLEDLNQYKMTIYVDVIGKSINEIIKKIKIPKESEIDFWDDENSYFFSSSEIVEIENISIEAKAVLQQVFHGARLMQAAAGSSLGFVGTFGAASTGTAISSLSGAAATNATLAFLGGGSLATGGGGMALGSSVLGGITIIPAAIILSNQFAKQAEESLTVATKYYAEVCEEVENIDYQILVLTKAINIQIEEIYSTIEKIQKIYNQKVYPKLLEMFNKNKNFQGFVNYKTCSISDKKRIQQAAYFLKSMKEIIAVKILDSNNDVSEESKSLVQKINNDKKIIGV